MTMHTHFSSMKKILVLGDSTSSSIGRTSEVWTKVISEKKIWGNRVEIIDTTCPGNTAASSLMSLIINLLRNPLSFKSAVLYIGNCDRITKPYKSNRFNILGVVIKSVKIALGFSKPRKYNWNKLGPFEWNSAINEDLEKSGEVRDFKRNLTWIRRICFLFRINLVVIIPRSNISFAPGSAKGNFLYYRIIGLQENWKEQELSGLYAILNCDSSQNLETQLSNIKILIASEEDMEKIYCAINNYAVALSNFGEHQSAINLLEALCLDHTQRMEIFTFNLALIHRKKGEQQKYEGLIEESLRLDVSSYRVDKVYAEAVAQVFRKSPNLVDMESNNYSSLILDHCHLNPAGQIQLANQILSVVMNKKVAGTNAANLTLKVLNPEIVNGDGRKWTEFFGVESNFDSLNLGLSDNLPKDSHNADDESFPLSKFPHKIERDYFERNMESLIYTYVKFPEIIASATLFNLFSKYSTFKDDELSKRTEYEIQRLESFFCQIGLKPECLILRDFNAFERKAWVNKIFYKVCEELEALLLAEPICDLRVRLTMQWYFRESLMFGFESSEDSKFEREKFRRILESLMIAGLLSQENQLKILNELLSLTLNIKKKTASFTPNRNLHDVTLDSFVKELAIIESLKRNWEMVDEAK